MNDLERKAAEVQLGVLKLQHKLLESRLKGDLPGHPFRGNQWSGGGGSSGGGSSASGGGQVSSSEMMARLVSVTEVEDPDELNGIDQWGGKAGEEAKNVLEDVEAGDSVKAALDSDGNVVGVISYNVVDSHLTGDEVIKVENLASNARGVGTRLMQEVFVVAEDAGFGVELVATPESIGFYRKLGMTELPGGKVPEFTFSHRQITEYLDDLEKRRADQDA